MPIGQLVVYWIRSTVQRPVSNFLRHRINAADVMQSWILVTQQLMKTWSLYSSRFATKIAILIHTVRWCCYVIWCSDDWISHSLNSFRLILCCLVGNWTLWNKLRWNVGSQSFYKFFLHLCHHVSAYIRYTFRLDELEVLCYSQMCHRCIA